MLRTRQITRIVVLALLGTYHVHLLYFAHELPSHFAFQFRSEIRKYSIQIDLVINLSNQFIVPYSIIGILSPILLVSAC